MVHMSLWDLHVMRINSKKKIHKITALRSFQNYKVRLGRFIRIGAQDQDGRLLCKPWKLDHDFGQIQYFNHGTINASKRFVAIGNYPLEHSNTSSSADLGKNFHAVSVKSINQDNSISKIEEAVFKINDDAHPSTSKINALFNPLVEELRAEIYYFSNH